MRTEVSTVQVKERTQSHSSESVPVGGQECQKSVLVPVSWLSHHQVPLLNGYV